MKKFILTFCVALIGFGTVNAQDGQGQQGQGQRQDRGQMREQMKTKIKEELKLNDVQADTLLSINQQFQMKMRQVRMDANLAEDKKAAQLKTLGEERTAKLKTVLTDDQLTKFEAYNESMRRNRGNGGNGGGNRQGGNGNGGNNNQQN